MTSSTVKRVSEKVYLLGDPYYQVYLVRGESCALVESGLSYTPRLVVAQLADLGISPQEIRYLIITHAHFDHICGASGLQQAFPESEILSSPIAAKVLAREKVIAGHFQEDRAVVETLLARGYLEDYDTSFQPPAVIKVDRIINEGDILDLGEGCELSFYMTPGHSPCSMSLYLSRDEVLFPSDCLGYPYRKMDIFPMYLSSYTDYVESIRKVFGLETAVLAFPQTPLLADKEKIKEFRQRCLEITEKVHAKIIDDYRNGRDWEDISAELFVRFYRDSLALQSESILNVCTDLLIRRSLEAANIAFLSSPKQGSKMMV